MVFNATFNDISVISWGSVLLMEESRENHRPAVSHWQTLSHNVVLNTPRLSRIPTHNFTPLLNSTFFVYTLCIYRNLYCLWTEINYTYQFRIFLAIGHIYFFIQTDEEYSKASTLALGDVRPVVQMFWQRQSILLICCLKLSFKQKAKLE